MMKENDKQINFNNTDLLLFLGKNFDQMKPHMNTLKSEIKEINKYKYINFFENGISFCLLNDLIESIHIYNKNIMKFDR